MLKNRTSGFAFRGGNRSIGPALGPSVSIRPLESVRTDQHERREGNQSLGERRGPTMTRTDADAERDVRLRFASGGETGFFMIDDLFNFCYCC